MVLMTLMPFLVYAECMMSAIEEDMIDGALRGKRRGVNRALPTRMGANIDVVGNDMESGSSTTALARAVWGNKTEIVKILLDAGVNPNLPVDRPPLWLAAAGGLVDIADILLTGGADLDATFPLGTALFGAKNLEMLTFLVEAGANVDAVDAEGRTAFMSVAAYGSVEMLRLMKAAGSPVGQTDNWGLNALHHAAKGRATTNMKQLLKWGFNVNARSHDGMTALHCAIVGGSTQAVRVLIEAGADVNADWWWEESDYVGVVALAARFGSLEMVRALLEAGGELHPERREGALVWAARAGKRNTFQFLLKKAQWPQAELEAARRYPLIADL
jgi:ankyrin repeat protein